MVVIIYSKKRQENIYIECAETMLFAFSKRQQPVIEIHIMKVTRYKHLEKASRE